MALTLWPGELVLKLLTIFRHPTGCLDVGVHGTMCHSTVWGIRKTLMLSFAHTDNCNDSSGAPQIHSWKMPSILRSQGYLH